RGGDRAGRRGPGGVPRADGRARRGRSARGAAEGPDVDPEAPQALRDQVEEDVSLMPLSKEQAQFYQTTLEMTRKQIDDLNAHMEEEVEKVKERLAELQTAKNAAKQIYDGACKILGVENDLEKEDVAAE